MILIRINEPTERAMPALIAFFLLLLAVTVQAAQWPYSPLKTQTITTTTCAAHPLDALLMEKLEKHGLSMNEMASPRTRVRRAFFDLLGTPASRSEVLALENNNSMASWNHLLDRLLASPRFGETWARMWLDAVRYAETNGYERDGPKPNAWRYRDYVIEAFNDDKAYDRFICEQLAGDLLYPENASALIATGFYRLHVYDDEPDDALQADYDMLDDMLSTIGSVFLGTTIGCARCHDHKFDAIEQLDYYRLLGFIHQVEPYGRPHQGGGSRPIGRITRWLATDSELTAWREEKDGRLRHLETLLGQGGVDAAGPIEEKIEALKKLGPPFEEALAVSDRPVEDQIPVVRLRRGDPRLPAEVVDAAFPPLLGKTKKATDPSRAELASWISSPEPLTARVMANRIWQRLFGRGLVSTPNDFGKAGSGSIHADLLDHLASQFIHQEWSIKSLIRYIMTSKTYQMSSSIHSPQNHVKDPDNQWFWRQEIRRLDAEAIRDSLLDLSGDLNRKTGGPSVYPELPQEVHHTQDSMRKGWGKSPESEQNRRSIYVYAKRALPLPILEVFDASHSSFSIGRRPMTTVAPQALMLLNSEFMQQRAENLAMKFSETDALFEHIWQRPPTQGEKEACKELWEKLQEEEPSKTDRRTLKQRYVKTIALAMLNASETITID